jgi:hypothetical protein
MVVFTAFYGCDRADAPTERKDRKQSLEEPQKKSARDDRRAVEANEGPNAPDDRHDEPTTAALAAQEVG